MEVAGLPSNTAFSVTVLAINPAGFKSIGPAIHLKTRPPLRSTENGALISAASENGPATVRVTSSYFEAALPSPLARESSATQHQTKRTASARRNSPAILGGEQLSGQSFQVGNKNQVESSENLQRMTERLDFLRREQERVDNEIFEQEQESKREVTGLGKERDRLRQELKEKEEASSELRKHGNHLDKLNRMAQSKKAAKEKQLQQKKTERQKIRDDNDRWEKEILQMKFAIEEMQKENTKVIAIKDREVAEIQKRIADDQFVIRQLEEDIRTKGVEIKSMEKEIEQMNNEGNGDSDRARIEKENDQAWEAKVQILQTQLASMMQVFQKSELERQRAEEHLGWWMSKRAINPEHFAPIPSLDFVSSTQRNRSRRNRQTSSRTSTISSPSANYPGVSIAHSTAIPTSFSSSSPFFSMGNGTTIPAVTEQAGMSHRETEILNTGGAVSPTANDLLPSNLFREENLNTQRLIEMTGPESLGSANADALLGHVVSNSDPSVHGPLTPVSASSQAGSIFPSPHDSLHNLHGYPSRNDMFGETDQHSINPTSSPFLPSVAADSNPLVTSRLANLFSATFSRQRDKQGAQEPPVLGTLKQGQSQSFPRNVGQDPLDPSGGRRRRGSYGSWANPVAGLLNRNTIASGDSGLISARTSSGRRSRLNMFGPKFNGVEPTPFADQTSSSRPSSTYSHDQALARPSSDSQRIGWILAENMPSHNSPLGVSSWAAIGGPWSRAPSRRPSVQYGSTSNLSIGSTPLDADGHQGSLSKQGYEQAPIGTRPLSSQRPVTPKLNPAAPTFKMLFGRGDAKKKTERSKDKGSDKSEADDGESILETSPQNPRLSRDAQSITTATSTAESHDSFDRSTSGTLSEVVNPSGPKETLMQKITRKSSSSKFNVPWSKERSIFSKRAGDPTTPGETDEDAPNDGHLSKSTDSATITSQQEKAGRTSLSWTNLRRKSKRSDPVLGEFNEKDVELGDDDDL